jgi:hypothetical protein
VLSSSTSNFSADLSRWNLSSIASTKDKFSYFMSFIRMTLQQVF